jgi:hypothetical protein
MKAKEKQLNSFRLEPEIHKELKILCAEKRVSIQGFIESLIMEALKKGV